MTGVDRVIGVIESHPLNNQNRTDIRQIALQSIHNNIPYFLQGQYNLETLFSGLNSTQKEEFIFQLKTRLIQLFIIGINLTPNSGKIYDSYDIFKALTPIEYMYAYLPYKSTVTQEIMYNEQGEEAMYRRGFLFPMSHYTHYMLKYVPIESIRLVRSLNRRLIDAFSVKGDSELEAYIKTVPSTTEIDSNGLNKSLQLRVINHILDALNVKRSFGFADVYAIIVESYSPYF